MININVRDEKAVIIVTDVKLFNNVYRFDIDVPCKKFDDENIEEVMIDLNTAYILDSNCISVIECEHNDKNKLLKYVNSYLDILDFVCIQDDNNVLTVYNTRKTEKCLDSDFTRLFDQNEFTDIIIS